MWTGCPGLASMLACFLLTVTQHSRWHPFTDTILIGQYPLLQQEKEMQKRDWRIFTPTIFRQMEYRYLDNFKIAAGFELHLKACLVANNIVIHQIADKMSQFEELRKRQKKTPVYGNAL